MKTKTYVFDLDGTLCTTRMVNGDPQYFTSTPLYDRIAKVNRLYDAGHTIIIDTARGSHSGKNWFYKTVDQLKGWGLRFHHLRTGTKFAADYFIDDRAQKDTDFFNEQVLAHESGGNTKVVLVSRIFKEASDDRMEKLIDEIRFIEDIPARFKSKFPEIVHHGKDEARHKTFYEMKHYNLPSLRRLIFSGQLTPDEILYWSNKVTAFSLELYNHEVLETPKNFFEALHWSRFNNRMNELKTKSVWFNDTLQDATITINGRELINAPFAVHKLKQMEHLFAPTLVGRWSHSDLHFSNVLIDIENDDFILIDPRGYPFCDSYYDFGKLWHSVNGKYEMITEHMWGLDGNNYTLFHNDVFNTLEAVKARLPQDLFARYVTENLSTAMLKIAFNEAMHFITLVPFQLEHDGIEAKARVAYLTGVELLNNVLETI